MAFCKWGKIPTICRNRRTFESFHLGKQQQRWRQRRWKFSRRRRKRPAPATRQGASSSPGRSSDSCAADLRLRVPGFQYFESGHPYPDQSSWSAAEAILSFLVRCSPQTLVLFLISGGGSALVEKPLQSTITLQDLRRFYELLVTCGASIEEMNILRKHYSAVKGGRLALRASPALQITLYVSDVPERLSSTVASGPTMPDESTWADCRRIAAQYDLLPKLPGSVRAVLEQHGLPETPKSGHPAFNRSRYYCLLSNRDAVQNLLQLASVRGIRAGFDGGCDEWHFQRAADYLLARLDTLRRQFPGEPLLLFSGGELSSPVKGNGQGGRNQAFVLDCVPKIAGQCVAVLSAGTDGIDGNSPVAGAIADGESAARAESLGLNPDEFLARADSYRFFERLGDTIMTGSTGTNVRDLRILLAYC